MSMMQEFKEFAQKGNVLDLAVAVVMGAAIAKVIDGLLEGIIMPFISMLVGKPDFSQLGSELNGTFFPYGKFIQAVLMFVLVAFALFLFIKAMNKMKNNKTAVVPPSSTDLLLAEIRDALKK